MRRPTEREIITTVKRYARLMGLSGYRLKISFAVEDQSSAAETAADAQYQLATISFNLDHITSQAEMRRVVIHELLHVVLDPLASNAKTMAGPHGDVVTYLEEQVVTAMENWPLWTKVK